ncbi:flagellar basal body-associated protein FliL [Alkalihalobacillus sp. AL-G]|uniref:flagellar basal body-associated protein FliL n=1 Tax=Alkalihalobacillus sp. AL-G TaxID=2926399 RepID=UPI00272AB02C|nr:flagellar basal body-associated protein FliL [Alkalihalobacillus sp. AL-G]WLD95161.1 flagellar basal body-associated protein FliL [Alkalihalobacillus sp. AL-G]
MNKKLVTTMLVMIAAISVVAVVGVILYFNLASDKTEAAESQLSASELIDLSIDTEEITTNLADKGFAKVQFRIQVDSSEAKKELETRMFQVQNSIIYELSGTKAAELQGPDGIQTLESELKKTINDYLEHGEVVRVYTTQKIVQ